MNPYYQTVGAPVMAKAISSHDVHLHPHAAHASLMTPFPSQIVQNEGSAREYLTSQSWPKSMQDTFLKSLSKIAIRVFICDDSGSMGQEDGKTLVSYQGKTTYAYFFLPSSLHLNVILSLIAFFFSYLFP
jgi:hypothetical protein